MDTKRGVVYLGIGSIVAEVSILNLSYNPRVRMETWSLHHNTPLKNNSHEMSFAIDCSSFNVADLLRACAYSNSHAYRYPDPNGNTHLHF